MDKAAPVYEQFLVLRYRASNVEPYPFEWLGLESSELGYAAILTRTCREYDRRFRNGEPKAQT